MDMEQAFDYQEAVPSTESKPTYNKSNYNNYKKGSYSKGSWNNQKRMPFDKNSVATKKLDVNMINFQVKYMSYGLFLSNLVEHYTPEMISNTKLVLDHLSSLGYVCRTPSLKDYPQNIKDSREAILNKLKQLDRVLSTSNFTYDKTKSDTFGIVKGMKSNYESISDGAKVFLARDLELIVGEYHNKPVDFAIMLLPININRSSTDFNYRVTGSCAFPIEVMKAIGKPWYNILNDQDFAAFKQDFKIGV